MGRLEVGGPFREDGVGGRLGAASGVKKESDEPDDHVWESVGMDILNVWMYVYR